MSIIVRHLFVLFVGASKTAFDAILRILKSILYANYWTISIRTVNLTYTNIHIYEYCFRCFIHDCHIAQAFSKIMKINLCIFIFETIAANNHFTAYNNLTWIIYFPKSRENEYIYLDKLKINHNKRISSNIPSLFTYIIIQRFLTKFYRFNNKSLFLYPVTSGSCSK